MRRLAVVPVAALALLVAAPGVATADVIFDQADADELATTLAEAYEAQNVCYGWSISVDNEGVPQTSTGSNFGAGQALQDAGSGCAKSVEFQANISWTSESSESEDSASYQVLSTPSGPTTADLDDLEIMSSDGLVGDNVDADVYKAVAALPLLAADAGLADPIEASPAPEADSGDAAPTDSPGSDFWRESGMQILWGALLLLGGGVFAWYAIKSSRRPARRRTIGPVGPVEEQIPEYVPPEWSAEPAPEPAAEPESESAAEPEAESAAEPEAESAAEPESEPAAESAAEPESDAEPAAESAEAQSEPDETEPEPAADAAPEDPEPADSAEPAPAEPVENQPVEKPPADKPDPETRPEG